MVENQIISLFNKTFPPYILSCQFIVFSYLACRIYDPNDDIPILAFDLNYKTKELYCLVYSTSLTLTSGVTFLPNILSYIEKDTTKIDNFYQKIKLLTR